MKKFNFLMMAAAAIIFCGCQNLCATNSAKPEYSVLVLGDLHYDGMEYHTSKPLTGNRAKEQKRNCEMWQKATPDLLTLAAKYATSDVPFVAQVGDFTQGDCDTVELQVKMITDGFAKVKSYFPNHKLLPVRGNHDVRMFKGNSGTPTVKAFFPLIAKELGVEKINGTYSVRQGKDLYIFFDSFVSKKQCIPALKKILADNADARHTFFITHLPVLNCCMGNPAWLVPNVNEVRKLLLERNAIILAAHTHVASLIQAERDGKKLTQAVICTVGKSWRPNEKMDIFLNGFDAYCKKLGAKRLEQKRLKPSFDDLKTFKLPVFEIYRFGTGFAMLRIAGDQVYLDYYTNDSGKPAMSKQLR